MANYLMNKLDYQRLRERISQAETDGNTSRSQLINLTRRVAEAKVTEAASLPANVITMNTKVLVSNLSSGQVFTLQLAYPESVDPQQQQISILTPLATALLGSCEGEVISLETPCGSARFRIDRICQPETTGDLTS